MPICDPSDRFFYQYLTLIMTHDRLFYEYFLAAVLCDREIFAKLTRYDDMLQSEKHKSNPVKSEFKSILQRRH